MINSIQFNSIITEEWYSLRCVDCERVRNLAAAGALDRAQNSIRKTARCWLASDGAGWRWMHFLVIEYFESIWDSLDIK